MTLVHLQYYLPMLITSIKTRVLVPPQDDLPAVIKKALP
ncbi:MAG: hypothetical protein Greene071436_374, partial [Parcubacteria group bacterium Greene0714_36]